MPFVGVARAADIPVGKGQFVDNHSVPAAVFNAGQGRFYAVRSRCPHEDGPLSEGWLEGDTVVCPWHGFDFDVATGACRVAEDLAIGVYPTRLSNGVVEVELP
jgi:nitrite reductase/ring-hydroxylating ferredoxin subunit